MAITLDGSNLTTSGVINRGTAQASTSGTSIDFTGIPIGATRITVMFNDVSTNGTDSPIIRLGTASGIESSAIYYAMSGANTTSNTASAVNYTTAFGIQSGLASNSVIGQIVFCNISSNTWIGTGIFTGNTSAITYSLGRVALSGVLTQLRITTSGGTNTFDAGSINILYE
jgi:hypothetical protein